MNPFKKIFVAVEPERKDQASLQRAALLAERTGAHLHLFVCAYDTAIGIATFLSGKHRRRIIRTVVEGNQALVDRLAANLRKQGLDVTTQVVWDRHPSEAIIRALHASEADLLVKRAKSSTSMPEVIFSHSDWNILRNTHCPVLLVKSGQWDDVGQVLAAVNAAPEDGTHKELNGLVLEGARYLADVLDFQMHLVSAYPAPPARVPLAVGVEHPINYRKKMTKMVGKRVGKFAASYGVEEEHIHLVEGPVDWVITKVAHEIVAEFVVLGTVARVGVGGLTLGNTAEHILSQLRCDVLVVKVTTQEDANQPLP